jgi:hypothetical protein
MSRWPKRTIASRNSTSHRRLAAAACAAAGVLSLAPAWPAAGETAEPEALAHCAALEKRCRADAQSGLGDPTLSLTLKLHLCLVDAGSCRRDPAAFGYRATGATAPAAGQAPLGRGATSRAPDVSGMRWRWTDETPAPAGPKPTTGGTAAVAKPPPTSLPVPVLSPLPDLGPPARR